MESMMKDIQSEELKGVTEVIIRFPNKELIVSPVEVSSIVMPGSEGSLYQVTGETREKLIMGDSPPSAAEVEKGTVEIKEEDIKMVSEQTNSSLEEAEAALKETNGDLAEAIMKLM